MLTKTLYMRGLQCQKLLWHAYKKELPEITLSDQFMFDQGRDVEIYAKKLFPSGVDLKELSNDEAIEETKHLLGSNLTIFEATISNENLFLKADVLESSGDKYNLYEIKGSTKQKPEHLQDLAFQRYVLEKAGVQLDRIYVIYLNKEYVKDGEIDPEQLLIKEDVTEQVELIDDVEYNIGVSLETLKKDAPPAVEISKNCNKPYPCPLKPKCWDKEDTIFFLTNYRLYWNLFAQGVRKVSEMPANTRLTHKDEVIVEATATQETIISKEHIRYFLESLNYPLYHLDFETYNTGVPIFDRSRPWQKIAFQYSLHVETEDNVTHFEYLGGSEDPRPELLRRLKEQLGDTGDIIVYNESFEKSILKQLGDDFPEYKVWTENVINRIVDLAVPFKNFYYYNPQQEGKWSIKKVLPAITGKSYEGMDISKGDDASVKFFYSHMKDKFDKQPIRESLLKYCALDTEAMIFIIKELKKLVK